MTPAILTVKRVLTRGRSLRVHTIADTANRVREQGLSLVRFGDGEQAIMSAGAVSYQVFDENLKNALCRIARSDDDGLMVCVPDVFRGLSIYNKKTRAFWRESLAERRHEWLTYFDSGKVYGNAFFSRQVCE